MNVEKMLKRTFWIVGVVLLLLGTVGWYVRLNSGHLDANYGSIVTWGLWVAAYVFFSSMSAGLFIMAALHYVFGVERLRPVARPALFGAFVCLVMALLFIWVDLGKMSRVINVFAYANFRSPMAWMIWLYTAYMLLLVAILWLSVRRDLALRADSTDTRARFSRLLTLGARDVSADSDARDRKLVRRLSVVALPIALIFPGGVGALFAVVGARPAWNSGLTPLLFVVSGLASGAAALLFFSAIFQDGIRQWSLTVRLLSQMLIGLLVLDVMFQASEWIVGLTSSAPAHADALGLIVWGPYWPVFWIWQLGLGIIIPLILLLRARYHTSVAAVAAAGFLVAFGLFGLRLNIVIPALATEEVVGLGKAIASKRLQVSYIPSLMEWLVGAGIIGLGLLMFGLGDRYLPADPLTASGSERPPTLGSGDSSTTATSKDSHVHI